MTTRTTYRAPRLMKSVSSAAFNSIVLLFSMSLTGCIAVGGYSSSGGWFLWPGSFGLIIVVLLVLMLLRRRR